MKDYNVAVVGATGVVGSEMVKCLIQRHFPIGNLHLIASPSSKGKKITISDQDFVVNSIDEFDFSNIDIVLASAGSEVSEKHLTRIAQTGPVVIDNSSYFRTDPDIPLIIPEVNGHSILDYKKKNIIANPNCAAIIALVAIAPLHRFFSVKRLILVSYQAVSGKGKCALDELFNQTRDIYAGCDADDSKKIFNHQIAFNVIPQIGILNDDGISDEEEKIHFEVKKILGSSDIGVSATCVRVPVFVGHGVALNVEFDLPIVREDVIAILQKEQDSIVLTEIDDVATPVDVVNEDYVFVSRVRNDLSHKNTINMWAIGDNLRKGAALNAVQIAENLIKYI